MTSIKTIDPVVGLNKAPNVARNSVNPPEAYGVGVGKAGDIFEKEIANPFAVVVKRNTITNYQAIQNAFEKDLSDKMFNPETGIANRKGAQAEGAYGEITNYGVSQAQAYAENIKDPELRKKFLIESESTVIKYRSSTMKHESAEIKEYRKGVFDANLKTQTDKINDPNYSVTEADGPIITTDARSIYDKLVVENMMTNGESREESEANARKDVSKLYYQKAELLINSHDTKAAMTLLTYASPYMEERDKDILITKIKLIDESNADYVEGMKLFAKFGTDAQSAETYVRTNFDAGRSPGIMTNYSRTAQNSARQEVEVTKARKNDWWSKAPSVDWKSVQKGTAQYTSLLNEAMNALGPEAGIAAVDRMISANRPTTPKTVKTSSVIQRKFEEAVDFGDFDTENPGVSIIKFVEQWKEEGFDISEGQAYIWHQEYVEKTSNPIRKEFIADQMSTTFKGKSFEEKQNYLYAFRKTEATQKKFRAATGDTKPLSFEDYKNIHTEITKQLIIKKVGGGWLGGVSTESVSFSNMTPSQQDSLKGIYGVEGKVLSRDSSGRLIVVGDEKSTPNNENKNADSNELNIIPGEN